MNDCVARPPAAAKRAQRAKEVADRIATQVFGKTVKAREGWGPEQLVHLHKYITPTTIDIAGGRDATHRRIHTHAAPRRGNC